MNNHGERGLNIGFLDGHSEWLPASQVGRAYRRGYSHDIAFVTHRSTGQPLDPGLSTIDVSQGGRTYQQFVYGQVRPTAGTTRR